MSHRQRDRIDFWIHFGCGFVFIGLLTLLFLFRHIDSLGIEWSVAIWFTITSVIALLVGFKGDEMWYSLIHFLGSFRL